MHILIVGQTYAPDANGQAVFTTNLAEGLAREGHEVAALIPAYRLRSTETRRNNVRVLAAAALSLRPWYPEVRVTPFPKRAAKRCLDTFHPDIVHVQDHYPLSRGAWRIARKRGLPVVGTNHFLPENVSRNLPLPPQLEKFAKRFLWWSMLSVFNHFDAVTTPTKAAARIIQAQSIIPSVHPISCGVDLNTFAPRRIIDRAALRQRYGLDPNRTLLLFVGRVDHEKRLDVLLRALHHLQRHDIQLAIAGKGLHLASLQTLAQGLNLGDKVVFLGYVPAQDLPSLLNSADIFVMPSDAELQSIATLEAMASGLPIIAANARALPELVDDGVNGYLFAPGDVPGLARCIVQLVEERERWQAMGAASRQKVSCHGIENTIQRYQQLYQVVLSTQLVAARASFERLRVKRSRDSSWLSFL